MAYIISGLVSFLWRPFLDAFFQDEAYVWAQRKVLGLCHKHYPMLRQVHAIEAPSAKAEDEDSFKKWFDGENIPVCKQDAEIYKKTFTGRIHEASR
jgi:hypothetical protein